MWSMRYRRETKWETEVVAKDTEQVKEGVMYVQVCSKGSETSTSIRNIMGSPVEKFENLRDKYLQVQLIS